MNSKLNKNEHYIRSLITLKDKHKQLIHKQLLGLEEQKEQLILKIENIQQQIIAKDRDKDNYHRQFYISLKKEVFTADSIAIFKYVMQKFNLDKEDLIKQKDDLYNETETLDNDIEKCKLQLRKQIKQIKKYEFLNDYQVR